MHASRTVVPEVVGGGAEVVPETVGTVVEALGPASAGEAPLGKSYVVQIRATASAPYSHNEPGNCSASLLMCLPFLQSPL